MHKNPICNAWCWRKYCWAWIGFILPNQFNWINLGWQNLDETRSKVMVVLFCHGNPQIMYLCTAISLEGFCYIIGMVSKICIWWLLCFGSSSIFPWVCNWFHNWLTSYFLGFISAWVTRTFKSCRFAKRKVRITKKCILHSMVLCATIWFHSVVWISLNIYIRSY